MMTSGFKHLPNVVQDPHTAMLDEKWVTDAPPDGLGLLPERW